MITKKESRKLVRQITKLLRAQSDYEWRGGGDPADYEEIEAKHKKTYAEINAFISSITELNSDHAPHHPGL